MRQERESWRPQWADLAAFILPSRGRFWVTDGNRGDRRNYRILDNTATTAARTLQSGMMSGVTNPARPWFRLTTPDPELADLQDVKDWLYEVEQRMSTVIARSNAYDELNVVYGDLGVFGTAALLVEEDEDAVIRCQSFPIGSFMIADDQYRRVRYFAREFEISVSQCVEMFGLDNPGLTESTRVAYEQGQLRNRVRMMHLIRPNPEHDPQRQGGKFKPFVSYYWEQGAQGANATASDEQRGFLRVSGYDEFPVFAPRWDTTGDDSYATYCPGMVAIGDIRQLQLGEKRKMQALDKKVSPPVQAPPGLRNQPVNLAAAGVTWNPVPTQPMTPVYQVQFEIQEWEMVQNQVRQRIDDAFFANLFMLISRDDALQPKTATEILERREEKFIALGPVLQRLNRDLLQPFIDRIFNIMARRGMIPPPPPSIEGMELRVDFISIMAQAQKLAAVGGVERWISQVAQYAATTGDPSVLDVINAEEGFPEYADMLGVPPQWVRSFEEITAMRDSRAQAQAQAQAAETAKVEAEALAKLSQAQTGPNMGDNMLGAVLAGGGNLPADVGALPVGGLA